MEITDKQFISQKGVPLSEDMRKLIVAKLKELGSNEETKFSPRGAFSTVGNALNLDRRLVGRFWGQFCERRDYSTLKDKNRGGRPSNLSNVDIGYLEVLKTSDPSISYKQMNEKLKMFSTTNVSVSTIQRAVKSKFLEGEWTYKKLMTFSKDRFTDENLKYTESFMELLHQTDPYKLRFMDESGFHTPDVGTPKYGHSLKGTRGIMVNPNRKTPMTTLDLLVGLTGVMHAKTFNGAVDSFDFMDFITECVHSVNQYGELALQPGDILVIDNSPLHHSEVARSTQRWLEAQGIDVVFTPRYSPDMNPVELCFSKLKKILGRPNYRSRLVNDMSGCIYEVLNELTPSDMQGYFRETGYIFL